MKTGVPFVTADSDREVVALFAERARSLGAPFVALSHDRLADIEVTREQTRFRLRTRSWGELEVTTPLVGRHQAVNAALAIEVLEHVEPALRPDRNELLAGIRAVRHRGRDDVREVEGLTWLFDVAHNTAGVESLVDTIDRLDLPHPLVLLAGVLGDKDWGSMLPPLFSRVRSAVLTIPASAPVERRWDPAAAARAATAGGMGGEGAEIVVVEDFGAALARARDRAGSGTVIVTGSVHTVGNAMALLGIDPLA